jgi:hypothetical protein
MTFKKAVGKTKHLEKAWKEGLQALRAEDKPHIEPQDPRNLRGSVDVDTALRRIYPNANRWDFAIGYKHSNHPDDFIYWVELHTASDSQVKKVVKKAEWLRTWLKADNNPMNDFAREIIWVSSGATTFTLGAPQRKAMAAAGLTHRGLKLRISNQRG